jgi:ppGpp synthetase/RelA/SpoT-type nucleotidyltranferase
MDFDAEQFDRLVADKAWEAQKAHALGEPFLLSLARDAPLPENTPRPWHIMKQKSRNRILRKVRRYLANDSELDLGGAIDKVPDYAGGRLIVYCIGEARVLHTYIRDVVESRPDWRLEESSDNLYDARTSGWRGLTLNMSLLTGPDIWFPFELQILTFLQHTWDQLHHRIYEDPDRIPENLKEFFRRVSDDLHRVDIQLNDASEITRRFFQKQNN